MGIFDRLDRMASASIDRPNAVRMTLQPVVRLPNGRPIADPDRQPIAVRGILDTLDGQVPVELGNRGRAGNACARC